MNVAYWSPIPNDDENDDDDDDFTCEVDPQAKEDSTKVIDKGEIFHLCFK